MESVVLEICHSKAVPAGVGQLSRGQLCLIVQYLDGTAGPGGRLWCTTKIRVGPNLHEGYVVDSSAVTGINKVLLESGQVVSIPGSSIDIYDTVLTEGLSYVPHVFSHITPAWLTRVLEGPKYQPRVHDMLKFRVRPSTLTSTHRQRVKYFVEGESVSAPKGKPKLLLVKLAQAQRSASGDVSSNAVSRQKREMYAYQKILHEFTLQIAPMCFHASYEHSSNLGALVLQDLGMWHCAPSTGLQSLRDVQRFAASLARLHERYWEKTGDMEHHFIDAARSCLDDMEAATDGADEALETSLRCLSDPAFTLPRKVISTQIAATSHFANQWKKLADTGHDALQAAFDAQPKVMSHLSITPDHMMLGPEGHDPCLLVDWRHMGAAPVGFDLAAALTVVSDDLTGSDFTEEFFTAYQQALREEGMKVPLSDLKAYAKDCTAPLLLLAVCRVEDMHGLPHSGEPADEKLWTTGVNRPLRTALKLAEVLVQNKDLELLY